MYTARRNGAAPPAPASSEPVCRSSQQQQQQKEQQQPCVPTSQSASFKYSYVGSIKADARSSIFCVTFNNFDLRHRDTFAYVIQHQAFIYRLVPGGDMELLQVYEDSDSQTASSEGEYFYVCKWSVDTDSGAPLLLLAGRKALVRVLDVSRGRLLHTFAGHGKDINDIAVHPQRPNLFLTASDDESVRLWNIRSRTCVAVFAGEGGHRNKVLSLDFHPWDGHRFLSAGLDTAVKIWSLAPIQRLIDESERAQDGHVVSGAPRRTFPTRVVQQPLFSTLKVHNDYVDCVRWLGDMVLSKSVHDAVTLWRPHGQAQHRRPPPHQQQQQQQQQEGQGQRAAAAAGGGVGGVVDDDEDDNVGCGGGSDPQGGELAASRVSKITDFKLADSNRTWFVRFSSDINHNVLAVGSAKGRVFVFSPLVSSASSSSASQEPRARLYDKKCHLVVRQTAVSWDGATILAACDDGTVHRWDRQAGSEADMEED